MENLEEIINRLESNEKKATKKTIFKYLKKWPWFVGFIGIGVILGFLHFKNSPEMYEVESRILIKNEDNSIGSVFSLKNPLEMGNNKNIENQIGILKSYTLYRRALSNLDWDYFWYMKKALYDEELYNNEPFELQLSPNAINAQNVPVEITVVNEREYTLLASGETTMNGYVQVIDIEKKVKFGEPFVNDFFNFTIKNKEAGTDEEYILNFNNINTLTTAYLEKTQIEVEEDNSDLISVKIEGNNRHKEADFINELNSVFIEFGMESKNANSEKSVEFIDSQLSRIKGSLGTAEENFSNYRKNNQVMNLGQEAQMVYAKLEEIEQDQYLTQLQVDYYRDLQEYLDDSKKIGEMVSPSIIGITDANLNGMLTRLMELYSRRQVLSYSVQEKNPTLILLEKEIKIARDGLEETLKNQLKATESKMESMDERYASIQGRLKKLPETEKKLVGIQREFDLNNELYTYMLQKKAEASISKASIASEVQVIDPARVEAAVFTGPSLIKSVAAGIIGGGIIPFLFVTLAIFFNNKIETKDEVESESKIPVLEGIIKHGYKVKLPAIQHPRSGIAESFRGLRTNVNALLDKTGTTVISINSLIPGEGKSFISSNFSSIITKSNNKVLLIGADLHSPALHLILNIKESFGLSNYLKGELTYDEILTSTSVPNLSVIQAGPVPENPSDLLGNDKFEQLVEHARKSFDYIIIDNAPLMLVPDAVLTGNFSDVSLFILRMNYSHKNQVKQINKIVSFNRIKHAAIVINESTEREYGYGYGNKYWKKGYGEYKSRMSIA